MVQWEIALEEELMGFGGGYGVEYKEEGGQE